MVSSNSSKSNANAKATPSVRALALDTLMGVSKGKYANLAVDTVLRRSAISQQDKSLLTALVYGVLERKTTLDYLISRFSSRPLSELDEKLAWALRLGFYQLIYMDKIPDHAAVGETVALLPKKTAGFANAVMRAYLRFENSLGQGEQRENSLHSVEAWQTRFPDLGKSDCAYTAEAVALGVPTSLFELFSDALGYHTATSYLCALSKKPDLTLRANTLRTTPQALQDAIAKAGHAVRQGNYLPHALRVSDGHVTSLPGFDTGDFFVQDEASQLCVAVLDARPDDVVIDTCACPGSKSFGIAISMQNTGKLYAFDLHESKLSLIDDNASRLGISVITTDRRDARQPCQSLLGQADRVLCDVPCSGLGVIAKKPEIRHKDLSESARLPEIQADILEASAGYVKDGGVLVYSTCTVLPQENEQIVQAFMARHKEFVPYDFSFESKSGDVAPIVSQNGMATLFPHENQTDGFFICRMYKQTSHGS